MGFLRNNDYDAWLNQGGTLLGPKTGGGGNNPVAPSGPTGPQQSVAPTCASVQGQCPCYDGGCTDSNYMEYDANATCDDGTCSTLIIPGCTDATATNYNAQANVDDGTCTYPVVGCTNPAAQNYNPQAVQDDGSCQIVGCGDPNAANYNPNANYDCSGNPIGGVNTTTTGGGGTATPTKTGGVGTIGFDGCGYSNMGGCGNYNMASGCGTYYKSSRNRICFSSIKNGRR